MTSVPGSDTLVWSDEQTRFYLQLRIEEKLKDNIRNDVVNVTGRETIITKFHEAFGEKHTWIKFRNKFNTCKKQYKSLKKLSHNRTGLGYHSNGSIHMTDDWWNDRCKEWLGAKKFKDKPVANTYLMEQIFGSVHISGVEDWSAEQGENHLDNMFLEDDDAASESRQNLFNRRHSSLRSVIERTFGVWKAKWRILEQKHPKYEPEKVGENCDSNYDTSQFYSRFTL